MNKTFIRAALLRALRTFCQAAAAMIGSAALLSEVKWLEVLSGAALAAVLSLLTSAATGLPEAEKKQQADKTN